MRESRTRTSNAPLLCECGHSSRAHGPRLGEDFHTRCWFCDCDRFVVLEIPNEEEIVSSVVVAQGLAVSTSWVRAHGHELGGVKQMEGRRQWQFRLREAMEWGRRLIQASSYQTTIVTICPDCGGRSTTRRGRLGTEYVYAHHLPGMCLGSP